MCQRAFFLIKKERDVISLNMDMECLSRSQKQLHVSACGPFVQHSANNPGLPHKWLAQSTSPIVFSVHRDSQMFPEKNVMDSFLAGSIGVSAQKATTLMPCCGSLKDLLTLRCRRRNIFAAATKWNVWPTFAKGKSLSRKLPNWKTLR